MDSSGLAGVSGKNMSLSGHKPTFPIAIIAFTDIACFLNQLSLVIASCVSFSFI